MTVEELKNMSSYEVKNFIRQRLMYTAEEIQEARETITHNHVAFNLLHDIKPNLTLHKRFEMSEDYKSNDDVLSKFDDLGLMQCFYYLSTAFNNAEQANKYANMLKKSNFPKAFVVAYYNGTKISMVKLKGILIN